jgi:hypothetical protein
VISRYMYPASGQGRDHPVNPIRPHLPAIQSLCNKPSVGAVASYGTRQRFQFGLWSITAVYCLLERDLKIRLP